jgi:hypothetical protein
MHPETVNASPGEGARVEMNSNWKGRYFLPAAFLRAAQRAFMASESFLRPAAVRPPPFRADDLAAELPPPAFLLAAQRAFIASESFLRPAAVRPPLLFPAGFVAALVLVVPFRRAQRAFAAAASLARVAADIGRRPPRERRERFAPPELEPPKREDKRSSRAEICCLRESACVSF